MKMFEDFYNSREAMINAANQYITLLMGFASSPESEEGILTEESDSESEEEIEKGSSDKEVPDPGASDSTVVTPKDANGKKKEKKKSLKKEKLSVRDQKTVQSLRSLVSYTWTNSLDTKHRSPMLALICYW